MLMQIFGHNGYRMEGEGTWGGRWNGYGKRSLYECTQELWTQKILPETMLKSSTWAAVVLGQHMGREWGSIQTSGPSISSWGLWCLFYNQIVAQRSSANHNRHQTFRRENGDGNGKSVPRGTNRIGKQEGGHPHYSRPSTQGSTSYHYTSCRIASSTWGNQGPTHTSLWVYESYTVRLGYSGDNQHK